MIRRIPLVLIFVTLFVDYVCAQYTWRSRACSPAPAQSGVAQFSIGNKAYVVGGTTATGLYLNRVLEYDPVTNSWTQKNNFPVARAGMAVFVINDTAYVGIGSDGSSFYNEFWKYNATSDQWTQIASFPGAARYLGMTFVLNGKGYMGCGFDGNLYNDFYQYNPTTNTWTQMADFPGDARQTGFGAAVGGYGYMGLGWDGNNPFNDIYRYDDTLNAWTQVANFGGPARVAPGYFVLNDTLYITGGRQEPSPLYDDCWQYDLGSNSWIQQKNFACYSAPFSTTYGFVVNGHGYVSCGDYGNGTFSNQLLEFGPMDASFVTRVHVLGNDSSSCGASSRVLSTGNPCTLWSTGVTASQITVTSSGTYWAYWPDSCGMLTDTAAVIIGSVNAVTISAEPTTICADDSVLVCAPSGYSSYNWNVGGANNCVEARDAGDYYVTVTDANGCTAESNHVPIMVYPVPSISVVIDGDTLSSYGAVTYQWLLNSSPISGATFPVYIAREPGLYSLEITDTSGCSEISQQFVVTGVDDLIERNVSLFPNPAASNSQLIVDYGLIGSKLEIFDDKGCLVFQSEISNQKSEITIAALPSGIYFLHISSSAINITRKLVKL